MKLLADWRAADWQASAAHPRPQLAISRLATQSCGADKLSKLSGNHSAPWSTAQNRDKSLDHKEQSLFNSAAIRRYTGDKINKQASGAQMMIFFRERLAVLAVPKTGTSTLEKTLSPKASATFRGPPHLKHTRAREFETNFRSLFEKKGLPAIETMAVMREPIQWLGSWFRYRQRPSLQGHPKSTAGVSFNDFVTAYLTEGRPAYANIAQQADFITDKNGALLVDHLYSYSDLPAALQFLEKRLQQTITLPLVNKSPQRGGEDMSLSPELTAELHRARALDFEIYEALQSGNLSRLR